MVNIDIWQRSVSYRKVYVELSKRIAKREHAKLENVTVENKKPLFSKQKGASSEDNTSECQNW